MILLVKIYLRLPSTVYRFSADACFLPTVYLNEPMQRTSLVPRNFKMKISIWYKLLRLTFAASKGCISRDNQRILLKFTLANPGNDACLVLRCRNLERNPHIVN